MTTDHTPAGEPEHVQATVQPCKWQPEKAPGGGIFRNLVSTPDPTPICRLQFATVGHRPGCTPGHTVAVTGRRRHTGPFSSCQSQRRRRPGLKPRQHHDAGIPVGSPAARGSLSGGSLRTLRRRRFLSATGSLAGCTVKKSIPPQWAMTRSRPAVSTWGFWVVDVRRWGCC